MPALSFSQALLLALGVCLLGGIAEALCAGRGVKSYLRSLRRPRFSPPFGLWLIIGGLYYLACGTILIRLLGFVAESRTRAAALMLTLLLMAVNAFWNYLFFRARNLRASCLTSFPYALLAAALLACLGRIDRIAALVFLPYCLYLFFAGWWGFRLWQANR